MGSHSRLRVRAGRRQASRQPSLRQVTVDMEGMDRHSGEGTADAEGGAARARFSFQWLMRMTSL